MKALSQYGFAGNTIVSFLGDHGESLYKSGRVLTQYGFADDTIVSFLGDHGDNVYKSRRVLAQYSFAAGNTICPFWETTVRT